MLSSAGLKDNTVFFSVFNRSAELFRLLVKIIIPITFLRNKEHRSDHIEASRHVGLTFNIRMRKLRSTVWRKTSFLDSDGGRTGGILTLLTAL